MSFNNGNERRKLNAKWEHLRVQYHEAGMSEETIQAMYEFDLGVLNSERAYITNTLTVSDTTDDSTATETSDFKQYEKAITVTDTYHETKTRFTWVGEFRMSGYTRVWRNSLTKNSSSLRCTSMRSTAP